MPNGFAACIREAVALEDKSALVLKRQPGSKTGYVGVIEVRWASCGGERMSMRLRRFDGT